jgi:4-hydroxy-tetrahydrodipicolinate reductase
MLNAILVGPGSMGEAITALWRARGHQIGARVGRGEAIVDPGADVAFEFTHPEEAEGRVKELMKLGIPTVCGTTGWDSTAARELATRNGVPLMVAANFSIGVAVMRRLVADAARALAPFAEFQPGIVERHHAKKKDAPSGTAKMLAATIAEAQGGAAPPVVSLRHGAIPGDHQVIFEGADEALEISHYVRTRQVFAAGAVAAAEWLANERPPGPVTFEQFLMTRLERRTS